MSAAINQVNGEGDGPDGWQHGGKDGVCGRKRASVPYRDARSPDKKVYRIASDLESRRGRAQARLRNGASVLDGTPTSKGVDGEGGHATTSPECEYRNTGSGHEFIYAIRLCTGSRCLPTERQESNTSIYQQSFATIGL